MLATGWSELPTPALAWWLQPFRTGIAIHTSRGILRVCAAPIFCAFAAAYSSACWESRCSCGIPCFPPFRGFTIHPASDLVVQRGELALRTREHSSPMRVGTSMLTLCSPGLRTPIFSAGCSCSLGSSLFTFSAPCSSLARRASCCSSRPPLALFGSPNLTIRPSPFGVDVQLLTIHACTGIF